MHTLVEWYCEWLAGAMKCFLSSSLRLGLSGHEHKCAALHYVQRVQEGKLDVSNHAPEDVLDFLKTATPADFNDSSDLEWRYLKTLPAEARGVLGGASTLLLSLSWRGKAALVWLRPD